MVFQTLSHNSEAILDRPRNGKSREGDVTILHKKKDDCSNGG